jgi:ribonucleotide reductase beta subunit family protein with ferritin-like domain
MLNIKLKTILIMSSYKLILDDTRSNILNIYINEFHRTSWVLNEIEDYFKKIDSINELDKNDYIILRNILVVLTSLDTKISFDAIELIQKDIYKLDNNALEALLVCKQWSSIEMVHAISYNRLFKKAYPFETSDNIIDEIKTFNEFIIFKDSNKENKIIDYLTTACLIEGIIIPVVFEILFTLKFEGVKKYGKVLFEGGLEINRIIFRDEMIHRDLIIDLIYEFYKKYIPEIKININNQKETMIKLINELIPFSCFSNIEKQHYLDLVNELFLIINNALDFQTKPSNVELDKYFIGKFKDNAYTQQFSTTPSYSIYPNVKTLDDDLF